MKVLKIGDTYKIVKEDVSIKKSLPAQKYVVTKSSNGDMCLKSLPKEKLGIVPEAYPYDYMNNVLTMVELFDTGNKSMGVVIDGDKQNGKTLSSKLLSMYAIDHNYPVIVVDRFFPEIATYINSIEEDIVVIFEDYQETYALGAKCGFVTAADQQYMMSDLLKADNPYKKMIVINANRRHIQDNDIICVSELFPCVCSVTYPDMYEIKKFVTTFLKKKYHDKIEKLLSFAFLHNISFGVLESLVNILNKGFDLEVASGILNYPKEMYTPVTYCVEYKGHFTEAYIDFNKGSETLLLNVDDSGNKEPVEFCLGCISYPEEDDCDYCLCASIIKPKDPMDIDNNFIYITKSSGIIYLDNYQNIDNPNRWRE